MQSFSAGEFRSTDGRPSDAPHWFMKAALAADLIAEYRSCVNHMGGL
ncbi:phage protease [Nitrosomonas communis]